MLLSILFTFQNVVFIIPFKVSITQLFIISSSLAVKLRSVAQILVSWLKYWLLSYSFLFWCLALTYAFWNSQVSTFVFKFSNVAINRLLFWNVFILKFLKFIPCVMFILRMEYLDTCGLYFYFIKARISWTYLHPIKLYNLCLSW